MKYVNVLVRFLCLLAVFCFIGVSCSKDDDEEVYNVSFHVDVINLRDEAVYVFYEDGSSSIVGAGKEFTTDRTAVSKNTYPTIGVRLSNGQVLDEKNVYDGDVYKLVVNKESSGQEVSDRIDTWSLVVELTNSSSNSVYLFVDGKQSSVVPSEKKLSSMIEITNQSEVSIAVKNASGDVLDSKKVSKNGSYVKEIKDPTFTITKIVLTKWAANNLFDRPDPWMRISYGDNLVGRTDYFPDKSDGSTCTWSDLNIEIKNIYSRVDFDLYDYDLGYSKSGSTFIDGLYTTSFYTYWKSTSFVMSTSSLQFTLYGVWK